MASVNSIVTKKTWQARYTWGERLGRGQFGQVYGATEQRGHKRKSERRVAIKVNDLRRASPVVVAALERELSIHPGLEHPNIVCVYDTFKDKDCIAMAMEYLPGGDLEAFVRTRKKLPEWRARRFSAQIIAGLQFLHEQGITHRDLKPANVLVTAPAPDTGCRNVKITDFGFACRSSSAACSEPAGTASEFGTGSICGSPAYMPVDTLNGGDPAMSPRRDAYAVGVMLLFMLVGGIPGKGIRDPRYKMPRLQLPRDWQKLLPEGDVRPVVAGLMKPTRENLTLAEAIATPWFEGPIVPPVPQPAGGVGVGAHGEVQTEDGVPPAEGRAVTPAPQPEEQVGGESPVAAQVQASTLTSEGGWEFVTAEAEVELKPDEVEKSWLRMESPPEPDAPPTPPTAPAMVAAASSASPYTAWIPGWSMVPYLGTQA